MSRTHVLTSAAGSAPSLAISSRQLATAVALSTTLNALCPTSQSTDHRPPPALAGS
jgi:hypothetical protein